VRALKFENLTTESGDII